MEIVDRVSIYSGQPMRDEDPAYKTRRILCLVPSAQPSEEPQASRFWMLLNSAA